MECEAAGPTLSVVIPALNEERAIDAILERVLAQRASLAAVGISRLEVIVVDDGSRDRTAERVAAHPEARLVQHEVNAGYGAALKTGFSEASGDLLAFLDADGTYPPERLPGLCQALLNAQIDPDVQAALLDSDQSRLEALLGATTNVCCMVHAPEDDEETPEDEPAEEDDQDDDGLKSALHLAVTAR